MSDSQGSSPKKGVKWLKGLMIGGAVGSVMALALGTRKGRKQAQELMERVIGKLGSREKIGEIIPLKPRKPKHQ